MRADPKDYMRTMIWQIHKDYENYNLEAIVGDALMM